jgi:hypothetical protein
MNMTIQNYLKAGLKLGLASCFALVFTASSTIAQTASQGTPRMDRPPRALADVGNAAAYLFDAARDSRWDDATYQLQAIQTGLHDLPTSLAPHDIWKLLRRRTRELATYVRRHDKVRTMDAANATTRLAADLSRTFDATVPIQVPLLSYFGRQLEVAVAGHDKARLRRAKSDLVQTWNTLRPQLEQRGKADEVRRLTDIVVSLEGTQQAAEIERLARMELDDVERLRSAFK